MKNLLLILLILASLFLAGLFYWKYTSTKNDLDLANLRMNDRDTRIYKQDKLVDSLQKRLSGTTIPTDTIQLETPPSAQFMDELGSLSESETSSLQQKGLRNPETDLKNDLIRKQQTLLQSAATNGASPAFEDIRILNDHYVLATFKNGKNSGSMLLKYNVTKGGITWKILDNAAGLWPD